MKSLPHIPMPLEYIDLQGTGNRAEVAEAEMTAKRLALDIVQGRIVVGSVGELIDRFLKERAPMIYADQSKNSIKERQYKTDNLKVFFLD